MSVSLKSLLSTLSARGPHRVLRGNLGIAGQPGVVYTPESGLNLPAVAFAHGWLTSAENYKSLLEHVASWGFVVAAPDTERGPIPSHLDLAADLLTTLDIVSKVRLGDGTISVHPDRLALAGHGMGAGAAVIAAAQRRVGAVAALYPAPTAPAAENIAPQLDIPALILAGTELDSVSSNARDLATGWAGPSILRRVDGASNNGIVEGRRLFAALGAGRYEHKTERTTRALLTGYLLNTLLGEKTYAPFADPEAEIPHSTVVDPTAEVEVETPKLSIGTVAKLIKG
ncbi:poly(ethylene terephthalate) hydrolase family protein [Nocardia mangyaensis]|uniref:poly(ethylene terephthalate) hydrolase family protein n=1 Tax=Nocardia mangyaensis TaxID=2213200 RepID=UPI002676A6CC|nr:dienelactone hydrolase family protein [Nocardia mangyaensis]MDO3647227.1 dienelactone hydrolase family protein [Nocardia mangyaensis]